MTDEERPTDPAPEDEAPATTDEGGGESAEEFREEVENDPSANPPEELDRLRGG